MEELSEEKISRNKLNSEEGRISPACNCKNAAEKRYVEKMNLLPSSSLDACSVSCVVLLVVKRKENRFQANNIFGLQLLVATA